MTIAVVTVALNKIVKSFCLLILSPDDDEKVASSNQQNQFKTEVQKPDPI